MKGIAFVSGYWKNNREPFVGYKVNLGSWDGNENDHDIFYYMDGYEPLGDHGDFVVTCVYKDVERVTK